MTVPKMPDRLPGDGALSLSWDDAGTYLTVRVQTDGVPQHLKLSAFNVWRVFAMLAILLKVRLPGALEKAIKL